MACKVCSGGLEWSGFHPPCPQPAMHCHPLKQMMSSTFACHLFKQGWACWGREVLWGLQDIHQHCPAPLQPTRIHIHQLKCVCVWGILVAFGSMCHGVPVSPLEEKLEWCKRDWKALLLPPPPPFWTCQSNSAGSECRSNRWWYHGQLLLDQLSWDHARVMCPPGCPKLDCLDLYAYWRLAVP